MDDPSTDPASRGRLNRDWHALLEPTSPAVDAAGGQQDPHDTRDWRTVVESDEEWAARIDEEFSVDEETGDILARKLTPYELALLAGANWARALRDEVWRARFQFGPINNCEDL